MSGKVIHQTFSVCLVFLPADRAHGFAHGLPMFRHRVVIPPQSAACIGAEFPVPACPVLYNSSAALRAELMQHAIQKFLFVLFHRVSPRMLHLAAKPLCFLRKAGKNALKMTGVSRITFIGRICYENNPPFVGFFCHCKQNHMEYLQFQKEYLILFPVSVEIQMLPACSRFAAFLLRWDCQTPGLSNSRFCTFEGAPVLPFPCHRDSNLPRGSKPFNSGKPDICPLSSFFCRGIACRGFASSSDPRTALDRRGAARCGQPQWLWCIFRASCS